MDNTNRAIVTVIGEDKVGIIAGVANTLADNKVNIVDINQTVMQGYFTMMMIVDLSLAEKTIADIQKELTALGEKIGIQIQIQHEDIFRFMHRI